MMPDPCGTASGICLWRAAMCDQHATEHRIHRTVATQLRYRSTVSPAAQMMAGASSPREPRAGLLGGKCQVKSGGEDDVVLFGARRRIADVNISESGLPAKPGVDFCNCPEVKRSAILGCLV
jgi:hypothetical protein